MKKIFTLLVCVLATMQMNAQQHAADNWYFGLNAHIDFSQGFPVMQSPGLLTTTEGCSSISDSAGGILFYTDGVSVWNKNNQVMPNGMGLMGTVSSTQSALVVPMPGNDSLYYIFTVDETGGANGFRYSIVNQNLQGGTGDVTVKNFPVLTNVTEKLTAVQQLNTNNYWITVHEWNSNAFYAYNLTAAGLSAVPVITNTGIVHTNAQIQNTYGQMKFNTCGTKLAVAAGYLDTVEVFDFDPATGVVANPLTIPMGAHVYGVEFSADGQRLYVSNYDPFRTLVQFDLTAGNTAAILASETILSSTPDIYALQLAPDNKIYVCKSFSQFLGVIDDPSIAGTGCNYIDMGLDLDPNFNAVSSALGLPGFVQSNFRGEVQCTTVGIAELQENTANIFPNPTTGEFTLQLASYRSPVEIEVMDNTGRLVEKFNIAATEKTFSFGKKLNTGMYLARVKSELGISAVKLVKL